MINAKHLTTPRPHPLPRIRPNNQNHNAHPAHMRAYLLCVFTFPFFIILTRGKRIFFCTVRFGVATTARCWRYDLHVCVCIGKYGIAGHFFVVVFSALTAGKVCFARHKTRVTQRKHRGRKKSASTKSCLFYCCSLRLEAWSFWLAFFGIRKSYRNTFESTL